MRKKTILIIEDDESIGEVLQIILKESGYNTILDMTGESVFKDKKVKVDLALVDYFLPTRNGVEIIAALGNIPTILMSANSESELSEIKDSSGASDYLPKPFEIKTLLKKIKALI